MCFLHIDCKESAVCIGFFLSRFARVDDYVENLSDRAVYLVTHVGLSFL